MRWSRWHLRARMADPPALAASVPCQCGQMFDLETLKVHAEFECELRLVTHRCRWDRCCADRLLTTGQLRMWAMLFLCRCLVVAHGLAADCEQQLQARELPAHTRRCGAETVHCPTCNHRFPRTEMAAHNKLNHQ